MEKELSTIQKLIDTVVTFCVNYSFQVVGAIIVLVLGAVIANWVAASLFKMLQKKNLDITLSKFLASVGRIVILAFALIIALGKFGITMAPFIAALSAAALGAGLAIQGPLSNYGAGLSIILSRPFIVGNTITIRNVSGVVQEVTLASTKLVNEDGVVITIPNHQAVGEILYNSKQNKVVEGLVGISYDSNPETAISLITKVLQAFPEVPKSPAPQIGISAFADSSISIAFRYWAPTVKHYQTSYAVNLAVYKALQTAKISLPFPQREVRIISQSSPALS